MPARSVGSQSDAACFAAIFDAQLVQQFEEIP